MPSNPNPYISRPMTNFVQERQQSFGSTGYVAEKLMPFVGVNGPTGKFYTKNSVFFNDLPDNFTARGSKDKANVLPDWSTSTGTYSISDFAVDAETAVADLDRTEVSPFIMSRQTEVARTQDAMMAQHEKFVHTIVTTSANYTAATNVKTGQGTAPGDTTKFYYWDDATNGTPLQDIENWCTQLIKVSGVVPNFIVIPQQVWSKVKFLSKFLTPTTYTQLNILDTTKFQDFFNIPNVFIPTTVHDTAQMGQASNFDFIWGNEIVLGYLPERPNLKTRAFGYTFQQTDVEGGSTVGQFRVRSWKDEGRGRGVYVDTVEMFVDRKICDASTFMLIKTPINPANL